jgi:hypothetical protein
MRTVKIREAVRMAEEHALGILESTDDAAFWGEDFFFEHMNGDEWKILAQARRFVMNRIRRGESE